MEAPTLCIFQICSLRLGLLCILDYNKMLSLLPKNISQDWPFPSFTQQEISSSGRVILPLTVTGHGLLGSASSFWAHLRWAVLVGKEAIPAFWISSLSVSGANLSLSTKILYDFPVFCILRENRVFNYSSNLPAVPPLIAQVSLSCYTPSSWEETAPCSQGSGNTSENSGDVAPSLGPLNIFHFIKLGRA